MTNRMGRLLLRLKEKVGIMLNGHDEHSRKTWIQLLEDIEDEAQKSLDSRT